MTDNEQLTIFSAIISAGSLLLSLVTLMYVDSSYRRDSRSVFDTKTCGFLFDQYQEEMSWLNEHIMNRLTALELAK